MANEFDPDKYLQEDIISEFDPDAYLSEEPESMGKTEASVRGAAQGLTFDFADELQAALESMGKDIGSVIGLTEPVEGEEPVTFDEQGRPIIPESSGKYYRERVKDIRKEYKKAAKDQPVAYYGSDIAAGILPALLTGGAGAAASIGKTAMKEGVKAAGKPALKAAKIGAGMGALTGAGISEADLTKGDAGGFAKDVGIGGIAGAGLGAATPALAKVGGKVTRKTGEIAKGITRALPGAEAAELAFKAGTKGIGVSQKAILDEAEKVAAKLNDKIMKVLAKSGVDRDKAVQLADEAGKRLNAGEAFDDIINDIIEKGAIGLDMKAKTKLLNNISSFKKGFEEQMIFKDLEAKTAKQAFMENAKYGSELETITEGKKPFGDILINPEGKGNVFSMRSKYSTRGPMGEKIEYIKTIAKDVKDSPIKKIIYDLENAKPSEVKKILDHINENLVGDMQKSPVGEEGTYRKLAVQLRKLLDESVEEFADPTGTMKGIYRGAEELGIKEAGRGTQDAIEKNIKAIAKKLSSSGNASELDKRLAFRKFREASPEFADVIDEAEFISKLNDKLGGMTEGVQTTNIKGLIGTAEGSVAKISNVVGKGATAIKPVTDATKKIANKVMNYPEDKLKVASKWLNSKENKALNAMGQQLEYALQQQDGTIRNALIWSLSQQPAFRREVDKAIENQESQYMQDLGLQQSDFTEPPSSDESVFALPPEMEEEEEDNVGRSPAAIEPIVEEDESVKMESNLPDTDNLPKGFFEQKKEDELSSLFDSELATKDSLAESEATRSQMGNVFDSEKALEDTKLKSDFNQYLKMKTEAEIEPEDVLLRKGNTFVNKNLEGYSSSDSRPKFNLGAIEGVLTGADKERGHAGKTPRYINPDTSEIKRYKKDNYGKGINVGLDYGPSTDLDKNKKGIQYNPMFGGEVVLSGMDENSPGHGPSVIIKNDNTVTIDGIEYDVYAAYGHNDENLVGLGPVKEDQPIATMGDAYYDKNGNFKNNDSKYGDHVDIRTFLIPKGEKWNVKDKLYINPKQLEDLLIDQQSEPVSNVFQDGGLALNEVEKNIIREKKQLGSGATAGTERSTLDDLLGSLRKLQGVSEEDMGQMEESAYSGDMNRLQELLDKLKIA